MYTQKLEVKDFEVWVPLSVLTPISCCPLRLKDKRTMLLPQKATEQGGRGIRGSEGQGVLGTAGGEGKGEE